MEAKELNSLALSITTHLANDDGDTPHTIYMAVREWELNNLKELYSKDSLCVNCKKKGWIVCDECKEQQYCIECDGMNGNHYSGCLAVE